MAKVTTDETAPETATQEAAAPSTAPAGDAKTLQALFTGYRWVLPAVVLGVLLTLGGVYLYTSQQESLQAEAAEQWVFAVDAFNRDSFALAIVGDGQNPGLERMVEDYGSTPTGNLCRYYLGASYLKLGEFEKGVAALKAYRKRDNLYGLMAFRGMAYGQEELGQFEAAALSYLEASEVIANAETTPLNLFDAARAYELAGKPEKALPLYQRIEEEFPLSTEGQGVAKDIARLETAQQYKTAPAAATAPAGPAAPTDSAAQQ